MVNNGKNCNYNIINFLLYCPEEMKEIKAVNNEETINFKIERLEHLAKKAYKDYLFNLKDLEYEKIFKKFELIYKHAERLDKVLKSGIKGIEFNPDYKENRLRYLNNFKGDIVDFIVGENII
jgi:hypothetical protein